MPKCFYRWANQPELAPYFGLLDTSGQEPRKMGGALDTGEGVDEEEVVTPCFSGLPMGYSSWALHMCQHEVEGVCRSASGAEDFQETRQGLPVEQGSGEGGLRSVYVDNLGVPSRNAGVINEHLRRLEAVFQKVGLGLREIFSATVEKDT